MPNAGEVLLAFVALYPCARRRCGSPAGCCSACWKSRSAPTRPRGGWPGVSVVIPAFNEEQVIALSVAAALAVDYPELEVVVLDDGSTDGTAAAAQQAAGADPRCRVIRDPVNRGKADRLNFGFRAARHELVAVIDADAHLHPAALKLLVARMRRGRR